MDCWVDGQPAHAVSLKDRGLAYGDGLFETIAVRNGTPVLLDRHMARWCAPSCWPMPSRSVKAYSS